MTNAWMQQVHIITASTITLKYHYINDSITGLFF